MEEPPPGSIVDSARGHSWARDANGDWWGCINCDRTMVNRWGWQLILDDTKDDLPLEIRLTTTDTST